MARLHTLPLTLGGSPCHQSSLTRLVPFLHKYSHTMSYRTVLHKLTAHRHAHKAVETYTVSQCGRISVFQMTMALEMLSSCLCLSFIWRFFFCASFNSERDRGAVWDELSLSLLTSVSTSVWANHIKAEQWLCLNMKNVSTTINYFLPRKIFAVFWQESNYSTWKQWALCVCLPLLLAPATISSYSSLCRWVSSIDLAGKFLKEVQTEDQTNCATVISLHPTALIRCSLLLIDYWKNGVSSVQ